MIEVKNLTKYYGTHRAIDDITFTITEGEVLGFLGPNGAGKSTTMKIITSYLSATEGSVTVDGLDVFEDSLAVRQLIGYLPEHPPLYLDMTVKKYLRFVAAIRGVPKHLIHGHVDTVVEKCGLQKYYTSLCGVLSKGYRQRVGIAQAMVHEPKYLILDEPTIGLDPIQIVEIRNLIKSFGRDHTVILSTHILPEVDMTCERVLIISDGQVVAEDSMAHLHENIRQSEEIQIDVRGDDGETLADILRAVDGIHTVTGGPASAGVSRLILTTDQTTDIRPEIARQIVKGGYDLIEMKNMAMTLEDIFVKVTMKS